jgi:uroporphyrinogen-III synthase
MSRLGITREANRITDLIRIAQLKGIEIVPLPLTTTSFIPFNKPDLDTIDWVIFTSQIGVESFFKNPVDSKLTLLNKIKFAAVGDKTEKALAKYNQKVDFKPSESYGKILFEEFVEKFKNQNIKVLYIRAETVNFEPDHIFKNYSIDFNSIITYKIEQSKIDNGLLDKIGVDDYIFFTAPSAVESFNKQFGKPKSKIIAIGNTTAEKMINHKWNNVIIMKNPDIDKVLEYI